MAQWMTIAEGTSLSSLKGLVANQELKKGTPVRFEMTLNSPVGHLFDMAGAELIFKPMMPEGLILKDVSSPDDYHVLIEAESDPVWLAAIVAFVRTHWLAISLVTIGVVAALGLLVTAIKIKAEMAWTIPMWITIVIIAGFALIAYLAYKGWKPGVAIGAGGT